MKNEIYNYMNTEKMNATTESILYSLLYNKKLTKKQMKEFNNSLTNYLNPTGYIPEKAYNIIKICIN